MKTIHSNQQADAEKVIEKCKVCFIGLADTDGMPYVLPMNFGYRPGFVYLHSGPEGTHLDVLSRNNQICITFSRGEDLVYQHEEVACSYSMRSECAICRGRVEYVEDIEEKTEIMNIMMANYSKREFTYSLPAISNVKVWRVPVDSYSMKTLGLTHKEYLSKTIEKKQD